MDKGYLRNSIYVSWNGGSLKSQIGFTYKKTTVVPLCEADAKEQKAFVQMIEGRFRVRADA